MSMYSLDAIQIKFGEHEYDVAVRRRFLLFNRNVCVYSNTSDARQFLIVI